MKPTIIAQLLILFLNVGRTFSEQTSISQWGDVSNQLRLSISLENGKNEISLGHEILLRVYIQNLTSNRTIHVHEFNQAIMDKSFAVKITSQTGDVLIPEKDISRYGGSGLVYFISPKQIHESELNISLLYGIKTVGLYKIVVTKTISDDFGKNPKTDVVSNPIYIKIGRKK